VKSVLLAKAVSKYLLHEGGHKEWAGYSLPLIVPAPPTKGTLACSRLWILELGDKVRSCHLLS
jgi:hypothetical protein